MRRGESLHTALGGRGPSPELQEIKKIKIKNKKIERSSTRLISFHQIPYQFDRRVLASMNDRGSYHAIKLHLLIQIINLDTEQVVIV